MQPALPLRDIHLPGEPEWWPPAWGWWLLAALLLLVLTLAGWQLLRTYRLGRQRRARIAHYRRLVSPDDTEISPVLQLRHASEFLRRLARRDAPHALALAGEDWLRYLDRDLPGQPFSQGPGRLLLDGVYRPSLPGEAVSAALQAIERRVEAGLS